MDLLTPSEPPLGLTSRGGIEAFVVVAGVNVCWIPAELGPIEPVDDIEGDGIGWECIVTELRPGEVERDRNGTGTMDIDAGAGRAVGAGLG